MRKGFFSKWKRSTLIVTLICVVALGVAAVSLTVNSGFAATAKAGKDVLVKAEEVISKNTEKLIEKTTEKKKSAKTTETTEDKNTETSTEQLNVQAADASEFASTNTTGNTAGNTTKKASASSSTSSATTTYDAPQESASAPEAPSYEPEPEPQPAAEPTNIYKYCPTNINGNVLYCSNEAAPGEVKDGICINGTRVLATTSGAWDSVQVCDPSVVAGNFSFNGGTYRYLMAYLGCATYNCTNNEVGFAVSNDLWNWTKVGRVVACVRDGFWGVGQPSLMNINNDGNVLLFYTSGTAAKTTTYVEYLGCSDLNNIVSYGKQEIKCSYDFISNADFAYANGSLYMTCDTHPFAGGALNFISDKQSVYEAAWDGSFDSIGRLGWNRVAQIGASSTGYAKNHNGCFVRDSYGNLAGRQVMVSTASEVGDYLANLFTYRFTTVGF